MTTVCENVLIERLVRDLPRSKRQIGGLHESDAELIRLPGTDTVLAVTTDSIAEEIEMGLYSDAYLIGWMAVVVNASDLAAVGADPLGILLNETLPYDLPAEERSDLQRGIRDACEACRLPVLGGDTNFAGHFQVGATAIGLIEDGRPLTRIGCRAGDFVFASGPLGLGSAFAVAVLNGSSTLFQPLPRLDHGRLLRAHASACMDTSDGALAALDQLMRLNDVGFVLSVEDALHATAGFLADRLDVPSWMMLAGLHGEFELVFTVPPDTVEALLNHAGLEGWQPIPLGRAVRDPGIWIDGPGGRSELDTGQIRNLFDGPFGDVQTCIRQLKSLEEPCTQ